MAAVGGASYDVSVSLKRVLKSAIIADGVHRGLNEVARALDKREAHFCVLSKAIDEPAYDKLVRALCQQHQIPIVEVEDKAELGEMVGQCKYDKEGKARKVVGCSAAVVTNWGRDDEAQQALQEYFKQQKSA